VHGKDRRPRIGIDARFQPTVGIGRYASELVKHLASIESNHKYVVYVGSTAQKAALQLDHPNFQVTVLPTPVLSLSGQVSLMRRLMMDGLELFHATNSWGIPLVQPCPLVSTLHDSFVRSAPESVYTRVRICGNFLDWYAMRRSAAILTVSHFSRGELARWFPGAAHKISVIYEGVASRFQPVTDTPVLQRVRQKYNVADQYLLYVGVAKRHKNLERLLTAYNALAQDKRQVYQLVLVTRASHQHGDYYRTLRQLGDPSGVRFIDYVDDVDLPALYSGAMAFILPSLYEGFGLPILEAMACGVPVIAAHASALPEIAGDAALWVDPCKVESIRGALLRLLEDAELRLGLIHRGLQRAQKFSWLTAAEQVQEVYCRVLCNGQQGKDDNRPHG